VRFLIIIPIALAVLVGFAFEIALSPLPSRTLTFEEQHCSCQIPYNWIIVKRSQGEFEATRVLGGTFVLYAKPEARSVDVTKPSFANALKSRMTASGHVITSDDVALFHGCPAYSYSFHKRINGYDIHTYTVTFFVNRYLYALAISQRYSDPTKDDGLMTALNSFALLDSNPH